MTRSLSAPTSDAPHSSGPTRPSFCRFRVQMTDNELLLRYRAGILGRLFLVGFLSLWLSFWTVGVMMMLRELWQNFEVTMLLMAIPFVTAEVAVIVIIFGLLFYRESLSITSEAVTLRRRALIPLSRRVIPTREVVYADYFYERTGKNGRSRLRIVTVGAPLLMASGVSSTDAGYAATLINNWLDQNATQRDRLPSEQERQAAQTSTTRSLKELFAARLEAKQHHSADDDEEPAEDEVLIPGEGPELPPSDSRWSAVSEYDGVTFTSRDRWQLSTAVTLTGIALFWNGIVSTILVASISEGKFHWGIGLFFTPFVVIGVAILFAWFQAVTAPAWRTTWILDRHEVIRRKSFLFLRRQRVTPITTVSHLELERVLDLSDGEDTAAQIYQLNLIDQANEQIVSLSSLSEGEARWMAREIYSACYHWFR